MSEERTWDEKKPPGGGFHLGEIRCCFYDTKQPNPPELREMIR